MREGTGSRPIAIITFAALAFLLPPARAQDASVAGVGSPSLARNWTALNGHPELLGYGQVLVKVEGEELVLVARPSSGGGFTARGPKRPDGSGFYTFEATLQRTRGTVGRLLGLGSEGPARVRLRLRENAGTGQFQGEEYLDDRLVARPTLLRRKRAFIGYSTLRDHLEALWIQNYSAQTALYYVGKGYQVRREKLDNQEELIAELEAARDDPYDRVVLLSHAGQDGPVLGWGYGGYDAGGPRGARQVSPPPSKEHPEMWPTLVAAVRAGTTPQAIVFASGCNTATKDWASTLARDADRTVVGPNAYTSWWRTPAHVRALEGEGETLQLLRWYQGGTLHEIPEGGRIEGTIPRDELRRVDIPLGDPAPHPDTGVRGWVMRTSEGSRSEAVMEKISGWNPLIEKHAATRYQADVMRAIVFEEQIHQNPPGLEELGESVGLGDTVGPSQIHVGLWGRTYGVTREQLRDPETHFRVMRQHLDKVTEEARARGLGDSPAALGSVWNNYKAGKVTAYGQRVQRFYLLFAQRQ